MQTICSPKSTVTGMSVESLQAYSYAADLVDVSLDTLTGSMAKNVKSMASAQMVRRNMRMPMRSSECRSRCQR
jgi:hypothetical protein